MQASTSANGPNSDEAFIWKNLNGKTCTNEPDGTEWCKIPKKLVYFVHDRFIWNIIAHLYHLHFPVDFIFLLFNVT